MWQRVPLRPLAFTCSLSDPTEAISGQAGCSTQPGLCSTPPPLVLELPSRTMILLDTLGLDAGCTPASKLLLHSQMQLGEFVMAKLFPTGTYASQHSNVLVVCCRKCAARTEQCGAGGTAGSGGTVNLDCTSPTPDNREDG